MKISTHWHVKTTTTTTRQPQQVSACDCCEVHGHVSSGKSAVVCRVLFLFCFPEPFLLPPPNHPLHTPSHRSAWNQTKRNTTCLAGPIQGVALGASGGAHGGPQQRGPDQGEDKHGDVRAQGGPSDGFARAGATMAGVAGRECLAATMVAMVLVIDCEVAADFSVVVVVVVVFVSIVK